MSMHVIAGSGPVGSAVAVCLARQGERVRVITRSGTGPAADGIETIAADAADTGRLTDLAKGAAALYNCASPPYHRWPQDWPPLAASLLSAAERTGAVLVTMSNLCGYGPVSHPVTEHDPQAATGSKGRTPRGRCAPLAWSSRTCGSSGEVGYQFTQPFVVDSAAYQDAFGAAPTPMGQALPATLTWWRDQGRAAARKE